MTKGREVQMVLMNKGYERGVAMLLTELFEKQAQLQRDLAHLAQSLDMMTNITAQVVEGTTAIRSQVESMQRGPEDEQ